MLFFLIWSVIIKVKLKFTSSNLCYYISLRFKFKCPTFSTFSTLGTSTRLSWIKFKTITKNTANISLGLENKITILNNMSLQKVIRIMFLTDKDRSSLTRIFRLIRHQMKTKTKTLKEKKSLMNREDKVILFKNNNQMSKDR